MADANGPTTYVDVDNVRDSSEIRNIYNNDAINQKIDILLEEHEAPPIKKSFSPKDVHEGVCSSISIVFSTLLLLGVSLIIVGIPPLYLQERRTRVIYVAILIPALTVLGTIIQFYSLEVPLRRFNRFLLHSARELDKHREYMQKVVETNRAAKRSFSVKLPREVSDMSTKENERSVFADFNKEQRTPFVYTMSPAARGEDQFDVEREMKWVDGQLHRFAEVNEVSIQPLMRQQQRILKVFLLAFIELQKMLLSFIIKGVHHSETASRAMADSVVSRTPVDLLDSKRMGATPLPHPMEAKAPAAKSPTSVRLPNFTPLVKSPAAATASHEGTDVASPDARPPCDDNDNGAAATAAAMAVLPQVRPSLSGPPVAKDANTEELERVSTASSNGDDVWVDPPTEDLRASGSAAAAVVQQEVVVNKNPADADEAAFPQSEESAPNELQDTAPDGAAATARGGGAAAAAAAVISVPSAVLVESADEQQLLSASKQFDESQTAAPRRSTITLVRGNRFYTDNPNVFFYVVVVQLDARGNYSKKAFGQPRVFGFEANMAHTKNDVPHSGETFTPLFKPGKDNKPYLTFWNKDRARQALTIMERKMTDFVYCHLEEQGRDPISDLSSLAVKVGEDGQPITKRSNSLRAIDGTNGGSNAQAPRESSFPEPFKVADSFIVAWAPLPDRAMRLTFLWVNLQWRNVSVLSPLPSLPLDEAVMHQNLNSADASTAGDVNTSVDLFNRFMPRVDSAYTLLPPPSPDYSTQKRHKDKSNFLPQSGEGPPQWMCVPVMECVINGVFCVLTSATLYVSEKDPEKTLFAELRGISIEDLSGSSRGTSLDGEGPSPHQPAGTVVREAIKLNQQR